jgi:PAS domain S-box-containing protein
MRHELQVLDVQSPANLEPPWQTSAVEGGISLVYIPLHSRKRQVGVLSLACAQKPFAPVDLNLLSAMGQQIAIALENARLYQAVAQAEREWAETFDAITDGISIHDAEFRIVHANRTLAGWLAIPAEELIGQTCYTLLHHGERPPRLCPLAQSMASGRPHTVEIEEPVLGGMFQVSTYPIFNGQGQVTGAVHILQDITERKRMEQQLIQSEKLAALGRLAASLAHEINNPLQALRSGLGLLIKGSHEKEKRQQYLQVVNHEIERLIAITERMLNFYRPSVEQPKRTDVNDVLDEVLTLADKKYSTAEWPCREIWSAACLWWKRWPISSSRSFSTSSSTPWMPCQMVENWQWSVDSTANTRRCGFPLRTQGRASRPEICLASLNPCTPRNPRVQAWAWLSATASSSATRGVSKSRVRWAWAAPSPCSCQYDRAPGEIQRVLWMESRTRSGLSVDHLPQQVADSELRTLNGSKSWPTGL